MFHLNDNSLVKEGHQDTNCVSLRRERRSAQVWWSICPAEHISKMGGAGVFVGTCNYLDDCEGGQKDEVDRCLLALDVKSYEQTHGEQEGGEEHPGVALHHLLHPRSKE